MTPYLRLVPDARRCFDAWRSVPHACFLLEPLLIGRLLYQARRIAADPVAAYHRDIVRPSILRLPPLTGTTDTTAEIHVLTSEKDWVNTVWALRSFYAQVPKRYALAIHGDPNLSTEVADALRSHFPDARVIEQKDIREEIIDSLSAYPLCQQFRATNTLSIKSFDFVHTLQAGKMILFDSDLLFFAPPTAFLAQLDADTRCNFFNRDVSTAYAVELSAIKAAGVDVVEEVNSGFGIVHRESMRHDWMEEFLQIPGMPEGHFWRIEQTLFALCSARFGMDLLPDEYRVFLKGPVGDKPYRHYVGAIRDLMYGEGMRKLKGSLLRDAAARKAG